MVVGARSALFLPFRDLGLAVVDEEHEAAYKQEDGVHYHARDMAVVRGRLTGFPVVLASATPSLESRVNADQGRYGRLSLPARFGARRLPDLAAIDLKRHPPDKGRWLSPPLVTALAETLARGEQALLFLNRRGYAPLTLCRACGHRFRCPSCTAWLVEHRFRRKLVCHHCGHDEPTPQACPACGTAGSSGRRRPGVERVEEEVRERFPDARTLVLSSDAAGGVKRLRAQIEAIEQGRVDVVIGTQLVAKGHNFPGLTLVGVVDADVGLASGDPRAARTHLPAPQSGDRPGRARRCAGARAPADPRPRTSADERDRRRRRRRLLRARRRGAPARELPPYGRLASILISGRTGRRRCSTRARSPAPHRRTARSRSWAPPRRRSCCSAAGSAIACWSRRRAARTSRAI